MNTKNLLFHLSQRMHWEAVLARGKGVAGMKIKIVGIAFN
jgi:hypothetical protein